MATQTSTLRNTSFLISIVILLALVPASAQTQVSAKTTPKPWLNSSLSPDERAAMVVKEMTLDEKISLLHGSGMSGLGPVSPLAVHSNGGAGYVIAIPRLGIPAIQMSDAAYGVRMSGENGRYSTALPACVAGAASWDLEAAHEYGALIGRELRAQGYNMSLGGGVNITREPRNGRSFEIGIRESDVAAVMCSYNRINGDYACENHYLLTDVLKKDWNFKGFVLSDWGGTHSAAKASAAGLDQEEPAEIFYGAEFKKAVEAGKIPKSELDDHVHRILRSMFATGVIDDPQEKSVVYVLGGLEVAQKIAEQSIVLLKNEQNQLPIDASKLHSIVVIGAHSDVGMISGGGSAQVDPPGGNAIMPPGKGRTHWQDHIWFPTSPLKTIKAKARGVSVQYDPGTDPSSAADAARAADVAIVFGYQWEIG